MFYLHYTGKSVMCHGLSFYLPLAVVLFQRDIFLIVIASWGMLRSYIEIAWFAS